MQKVIIPKKSHVLAQYLVPRRDLLHTTGLGKLGVRGRLRGRKELSRPYQLVFPKAFDQEKIKVSWNNTYFYSVIYPDIFYFILFCFFLFCYTHLKNVSQGP